MSSCRYDLQSLLSPIEEEEFFSRYWEKAPLVVAGEDSGRYSSLLSASDLDHIVTSACQTHPPSVELLGGAAGDGAHEPRGDGRVTAVYSAYERGASVRVIHAQRYWKPLHLLCRRLEQVFSFPVKANLYCTPASAQGLKLHWDTHDVLVLQISGRKRWLIYDPIVPLPLRDAPSLPFEGQNKMRPDRGGPRKQLHALDEGQHGAPTHDVVLAPGDLLYMPRGFIHQARTLDEPSAHLTVGIHALTWLDLLSVALGRVGNLDERFRRALPVGFANETGAADLSSGSFETLIEAFSQSADFRSAIREVAESFFESRQAVGYGTLAGADDTHGIDAETLIGRRPGMLVRLVVEGETAELASSHKAFAMPKVFAPALRFIARTSEFRAGQLPGRMSDHSKLALVRRLVREGFLSIVREPQRSENLPAASAPPQPEASTNSE